MDDFIPHTYNIRLANETELKNRSVKIITLNNNIQSIYNDTYLGIADDQKICEFCNQNKNKCPGHLVLYELQDYIPNPIVVNMFKIVLKSVCANCGAIPLNNEKLNALYINKNKLIHIAVADAIEKEEVCPHCGKKIQIYKTKSEYLWSKYILNDIVIDNNMEIKKLLDKFPDEHCKYINLEADHSHPKLFMTKYFTIPNYNIRTEKRDIKTGKVSILEDILKKLHIFNKESFYSSKSNEKLKDIDKITRPMKVFACVSRMITQLGEKDENLINRVIYDQTKQLNHIPMGIGDKEKDGFWRQELTAKRMNNTARSVIGPDPNLKPWQIGIPKYAAEKLFYPEVINHLNIDKIRSLVSNDTYPKVHKILKKNGKNLYVSNNKQFINNSLMIGDIAYRTVMDNDIIVTMRNPANHKGSWSALHAVIHNETNIKLQPSLCPKFNADFDGDEMNIYCPIDPKVIYDIYLQLSIETQVMDEKYMRPTITLTQDPLIGIIHLSYNNYKLNKDEINYLIKDLNINDLKDNPTGNDIISKIIPKGIYITSNSNVKDYYNKFNVSFPSTIIEDGEIKQGIIDSVFVGNKGGKLIVAIFNKYGAKRATEFIADAITLGNRSCQIIGNTLPMAWFSKNKDKITRNIEKNKQEIIDLSMNYTMNNINIPTSIDPKKYIENLTSIYLNKHSSTIEKLSINNMLNSPLFFNMLIKNFDTQINQIYGVIGQVSINSERPELQPNYTNRALRSFAFNSNFAEHRGYISNGYNSGMTEDELFFAAMEGRKDLYASKASVSEEGEFDKKINHNLLNIHYSSNNWVAGANNKIISLDYGMYNCYTIYKSKIKYYITQMNNEEINELSNIKEEIEALFNDRDENRNVLVNSYSVSQKKVFDENDVTITIPFPLETIIKELNTDVLKKDKIISNTECYNIVKEFNNNLPLLFGDKINNITESHTQIIKKIIRFYFASNIVIKKYKWDKETLIQCLDIIKNAYNKAILGYYEPIGPIAAQSIVEPTKQAKLNALHTKVILIGAVSTLNQTRGLKRIDELINGSSETENIIKNTITYLSLKPGVDSNIVLLKLKNISLNNLLYNFQIRIEDKISYIELTMDTDAMIENGMIYHMIVIKEIIRNKYQDKINDIKIDKPSVINPKITITIKNINDKQLIELAHDIKNNTIINGYDGINNATKVIIKNKPLFKDDGIVYLDEERIYVNSTFSNILKYADVLNNYIDFSKSYSNNIHDMYNIFGIVGVKNLIKQEFILEDIVKINEEHVDLLINYICSKKKMTGIKYSTNIRDSEDLFSKITFAEVTNGLENIIRHKNISSANNTIPSIIMKNKNSIGTAAVECGTDFNVLFDNKTYQELAEEFGL